MFIIIPTYAQIRSVKLILKVTPTCFGINTPSAGSLQLCELKLWIMKMIKHNTVVCSYDTMLVNVAAHHTQLTRLSSPNPSI